MKYANMAAFEKHLEGAAPNHFAEIYLVLAKEAFVRKQATDALTSLYLKGEHTPEFCLVAFDGEKHSVDGIMQELKNIPLFSKKRLFIVHNADAFDKSDTQKLESYAESPNRSVCLALSATAVNRATTFYKKMEKVGVVFDVADEKPWEKEKNVVDWLCSESGKMGKKMPSHLCLFLVKQLGTDQHLLLSELHKLICYVGDRPIITENDISAICSVVNLDNAWQLGEAIFRRDATTALRIGKGLLDDGAVLIVLLRQIRSQFQTEFQVCSIMTNGGTPADVAAEYPYMKGAILDRHVRLSQEYGMPRLKSGLLAIDETELQSKNSMVDPDFLAERLIIKLTT